MNLTYPLIFLFMSKYKMLRPLLMAALTMCIVLTSFRSVIAAKSPQSLIAESSWILRTTSGCFFSIPISFMLESGRLSEESLSTSWSGSCENDMVSGPGILRGVRDDKELFSYTGTLLAGLFEGAGTFQKAAGPAISGTFHAGRPVGPVILRGVRDAHYEGGWGDRGPEGHGTMVRADGGRYDGEWHNGRRDGYGFFIWPSGSRYDGYWHEDARTGQGIEVDSFGNRYEGEFKNGKRDGHGTYHYAAGVRLEAEWVKGAAVGPASVIESTGAHYDGGFQNGGPEGQGVFVETNGDRYEGEWHDGLPDGAGTLTRQGSGSVFSGQWKLGCFVDGERHAAFRIDESACAASLR